MSIERRDVLHLLTLAAGSAVLGNTTEAASQPAAQSTTPQSTPTEDTREKVLGIGGFFFRAQDPKALALWYQTHLGINPSPTTRDQKPWHTDSGVTSFTPFKATTTYFGDDITKTWMINFRVHNIEKLAAQLQSEGIPVKLDPETYPYGRFARLHDPEGNTIELWQPA